GPVVPEVPTGHQHVGGDHERTLGGDHGGVVPGAEQSGPATRQQRCDPLEQVLLGDVADAHLRSSWSWAGDVLSLMGGQSLIGAEDLVSGAATRTEEHTSEIQSRFAIVCRL